MAHSMKPFCTSVVVNKDAIPRMSLKNLNRFMEGKLMALACSRLNAFQIFWGSYGKVNRRHFFDKEIFRPISEMPEEAREMLERYAASNIIVLVPLSHTEFIVQASLRFCHYNVMTVQPSLSQYHSIGNSINIGIIVLTSHCWCNCAKVNTVIILY